MFRWIKLLNRGNKLRQVCERTRICRVIDSGYEGAMLKTYAEVARHSGHGLAVSLGILPARHIIFKYYYILL